ncbi:50S ribosomal protein L6 [Candidatus Wolfebacteria bacterium]|nr:50S ribosomal protein L6 [Candidatus Wolfebacteria bacterium]
MSKIGKKQINIPDGTDVSINEGIIKIKGKNGEITHKLLPFVNFKKEGKLIFFSIDHDTKQARSNWGTMRALVNNAVLGVNSEFSRILEIEGVGFKAATEGQNLVLNIGFSHPVKFIPSKGIKISVEKNEIKIFGFDKALVGKTAAEIRSFKKPEPYKGKGIKYKGEFIRRKEGKKAAGATK